MRRMPPKGSAGWFSPEELRSLYMRICARFPAAADFEPCDCGVTLAIIPRRCVGEQHMVIDDAEFLVEAATTITLNGLPNSNYLGADRVLVIGERA